MTHRQLRLPLYGRHEEPLPLPQHPPHTRPASKQLASPALPTHVKALSMHQPWASLLFCFEPNVLRATLDADVSSALKGSPIRLAAKTMETRSWKTPHRGALLIHAARRIEDLYDLFYTEPFHSVLTRWGGFSSPDDVPVGCLLRLNRLDAIWRTEQITFKADSNIPFDRLESAFGDFSPGRYAWHLPCPVPFAAPIPYRGERSLFDVPTDILPPEATDALRRWMTL